MNHVIMQKFRSLPRGVEVRNLEISQKIAIIIYVAHTKMQNAMY